MVPHSVQAVTIKDVAFLIIGRNLSMARLPAPGMTFAANCALPLAHWRGRWRFKACHHPLRGEGKVAVRRDGIRKGRDGNPPRPFYHVTI